MNLQNMLFLTTFLSITEVQSQFTMINGLSCPDTHIHSYGSDGCAENSDFEGMVCANDGQSDEAYCYYSNEGSFFCGYCGDEAYTGMSTTVDTSTTIDTTMINGLSCLDTHIHSFDDGCSDEHDDYDGMVCGNDGQANEAYCYHSNDGDFLCGYCGDEAYTGMNTTVNTESYHQYQLVSASSAGITSLEDAHSFCVENYPDGSLATIYSTEENDEAASACGANACCIGLTEDGWVTNPLSDDGTGYANIPYSHWYNDDATDIADAPCAVLYGHDHSDEYNTYWQIENSQMKYFLCEYYDYDEYEYDYEYYEDHEVAGIISLVAGGPCLFGLFVGLLSCCLYHRRRRKKEEAQRILPLNADREQCEETLQKMKKDHATDIDALDVALEEAQKQKDAEIQEVEQRRADAIAKKEEDIKITREKWASEVKQVEAQIDGFKQQAKDAEKRAEKAKKDSQQQLDEASKEMKKVQKEKDEATKIKQAAEEQMANAKEQVKQAEMERKEATKTLKKAQKSEKGKLKIQNEGLQEENDKLMDIMGLIKSDCIQKLSQLRDTLGNDPNQITSCTALSTAINTIETNLKGKKSKTSTKNSVRMLAAASTQMAMAAKKAEEGIKKAEATDKNKIIAEARATLKKYNRAKSSDQSGFGNFTSWSASYLADEYPLVTQTIVVYTSLSNAVDKYAAGHKECDSFYTMSRWAIYAFCLLYLTFIGWKLSYNGAWRFMKDFWFQWILFGMLLLIQLTMPPMPCYFTGNSDKYLLLSGMGMMGLMIGLVVIVNHPTYIRLHAKYFKNDDVSRLVEVTDFSTRQAEVNNFPNGAVKDRIKAIKYTSTYEGIRIEDICLNEDLTSWLPSQVHVTIAKFLKFNDDKDVVDEFKSIPKMYKLDVKANKYKLDGNNNALMFYPNDDNKANVVCLTSQQVQEVIAKYNAEKKNDGGNEETKEEEKEADVPSMEMMPTNTSNVSLSASIIEEEEDERHSQLFDAMMAGDVVSDEEEEQNECGLEFHDKTIPCELKSDDLYLIDPSIRNLTVALGWDANTANRIDVDASVIVLNEQTSDDDARSFTKKAIVSFMTQQYGNKAIIHAGDNLTGRGNGDDEQIKIKLDELDNDDEADVLAVVVTIYEGSKSFRDVNNCYVRLLDAGENELCRFNLSEGYGTNAMIMGHIEKRSNGLWSLITDGIECKGRRAAQCIPDVMDAIKICHPTASIPITQPIVNGIEETKVAEEEETNHQINNNTIQFVEESKGDYDDNDQHIPNQTSLIMKSTNSDYHTIDIPAENSNIIALNVPSQQPYLTPSGSRSEGNNRTITAASPYDAVVYGIDDDDEEAEAFETIEFAPNEYCKLIRVYYEKDSEARKLKIIGMRFEMGCTDGNDDEDEDDMDDNKKKRKVYNLGEQRQLKVLGGSRRSTVSGEKVKGPRQLDTDVFIDCEIIKPSKDDSKCRYGLSHIRTYEEDNVVKALYFTFRKVDKKTLNHRSEYKTMCCGFKGFGAMGCCAKNSNLNEELQMTNNLVR